MIRIEHGDSREVLPTMAEASVDACVTDPPYGLEFMGKEWDAPWQVSSSSALFGKRKTKMPGWSATRNPTCRCGGRLRGAKRCECAAPEWDEAPNATRLRQMSAFQDWCQEWAEQVYRVLKPGGHLIAFGGTRTYHRLACAIEDAGFEIRDQIGWAFGSGFPKSHDVSKGIDKAAGVDREDKFEGAFQRRAGPTGNKRCDVCGKWLVSGSPCKCPRPQDAAVTDTARQWQGWGTALKPAWEPIVLARKPLIGTVAANVLAHGTGALNIDGCRVDIVEHERETIDNRSGAGIGTGNSMGRGIDRESGTIFKSHSLGRWPANLIHDGSDEVLAAFAAYGEGQSRVGKPRGSVKPGDGWGMTQTGAEYADSGSAARFFYSAKADASDRLQSKHPTVKPVDLMAYLCRLVTPPGGLVLDPFAGSGTTGMACMREGFDAILIEREAEYVADIRRRLAHVSGEDTPLFAQAAE